MAIFNAQRICDLWLAVVLGFMTHTLLEFLPLFFGQSIAAESADISALPTTNWMMVAILTLPLLLVVLINLSEAVWLRYLNIAVAALFLVLNISHPMELFGQDVFAYHQLAVMLLIIVANLALVYVAWLWVKATQGSPAVQQA